MKGKIEGVVLRDFASIFRKLNISDIRVEVQLDGWYAAMVDPDNVRLAEVLLSKEAWEEYDFTPKTFAIDANKLYKFASDFKKGEIVEIAFEDTRELEATFYLNGTLARTFKLLKEEAVRSAPKIPELEYKVELTLLAPQIKAIKDILATTLEGDWGNEVGIGVVECAHEEYELCLYVEDDEGIKNKACVALERATNYLVIEPCASIYNVDYFKSVFGLLTKEVVATGTVTMQFAFECPLKIGYERKGLEVKQILLAPKIDEEKKLTERDVLEELRTPFKPIEEEEVEVEIETTATTLYFIPTAKGKLLKPFRRIEYSDVELIDILLEKPFPEIEGILGSLKLEAIWKETSYGKYSAIIKEEEISREPADIDAIIKIVENYKLMKYPYLEIREYYKHPEQLEREKIELKGRVDALIRYHFGGFGARMYALAGYLTILADPTFSEEERESAKENAPEMFAWIKRKYDQIPFSELSKSPFYDDLKPLFEINELLSTLEEELEREPLGSDKIETIMSSFGELSKEYGETVDKYYKELTGKDLGAENIETRALLEYRSKEQIQDQVSWLKEQDIEPNSFEKAAMDYYGVEMPEEEPPWRRLMDVIKELEKEHGLEVPVDIAIAAATEAGIENPEDLIGELKRDGILYSPAKGLIARVEREEPPAKEPWMMTKEEWIRKHIKNADKLDKWIKQAELGETVEVLTTEIDESFPMGKVLIYGNIASTFPSAFDEPSKTIYINIDKPSDFVVEVLNIKDKTIQVYYALLHEVEHLKWAIEGKPLNLYSPETQYEKYYSHPSEIAAREVSNAFLRSLLDAQRKAIHEALKEGKPVPEEVLADYPELIEKPPEKEILFYKYVKKELDEGAVVYTSYPTPVSEILIAQLPDGRWNVHPDPPLFPEKPFTIRTEALEYAETNMKTIIEEETGEKPERIPEIPPPYELIKKEWLSPEELEQLKEDIADLKRARELWREKLPGYEAKQAIVGLDKDIADYEAKLKEFEEFERRLHEKEEEAKAEIEEKIKPLKPLISGAEAAITECDKGFASCLEECDDDYEECYEGCEAGEGFGKCKKECEKERDECRDKCEEDATECYDDSAREFIGEDIEEGDLTRAEEDLETFRDYISDELYEELEKKIKPPEIPVEEIKMTREEQEERCMVFYIAKGWLPDEIAEPCKLEIKEVKKYDEYLAAKLPERERTYDDIRKEAGRILIEKFDESKGVVDELLAEEKVPEKVKIHGVLKTRYRCPVCYRAASDNFCMVHSDVEAIDLLAADEPVKEAVINLAFLDLFKTKHPEKKRWSVDELHDAVGIDVDYAPAFLDKPRVPETYAEYYTREFNVEIEGVEKIVPPPSEKFEEVAAEEVIEIEKQEKIRDIKETIDLFIYRHREMTHPDEFLVHAEDVLALITELPVTEREYYRKKLTDMITLAKDLLAVPKKRIIKPEEVDFIKKDYSKLLAEGNYPLAGFLDYVLSHRGERMSTAVVDILETLEEVGYDKDKIEIIRGWFS